MIKFLKSFNTMGKIILGMGVISLVGAIVLHRYTGLPFLVLSVICACATMRD